MQMYACQMYCTQRCIIDNHSRRHLDLDGGHVGGRVTVPALVISAFPHARGLVVVSFISSKFTVHGLPFAAGDIALLFECFPYVCPEPVLVK